MKAMRGPGLGGRFRFQAGMAFAAAFLVAAGAGCGSSGFEAGPLGAVKVEPGDPIRIRTMTAFESEEELGSDRRRLVALALEHRGPVKGRAVAMGEGLDSDCSAEGGRAAARAVVGDPQVVGVVGPSCSAAAVTASPVISEAGLVMISPSNTSPSLTSDLRGNAAPNYHPGYYRTSNNDLNGALAVVQFAYNELGLRRVAVIHDGDAYTSGMAEAFSAAFEDIGGKVSVFTINRGDTDMVPVLTRVSRGDPDGVFFPLFPDEGSAIVRQIGQIPGLEDATLISASAIAETEFLVVPESEGVYIEGPALNFGDSANEETGKTSEQVMAEYRSLYGEVPTTIYAQHAYDATTILLKAIEEVAVEVSDALYIDRAKLREALTDVADFQGIVGTLTCDDFGDCGTGGVHILHHTDADATDASELAVVYRYAP